MKSVKDIGASAKSGMEKTKATLQEKGEKITSRDPLQKEIATEKKNARIHQAEREKLEAQRHNAAVSHGAGHTTGGGVLGGHGHTTGAGMGHPTGAEYTAAELAHHGGGHHTTTHDTTGGGHHTTTHDTTGGGTGTGTY